jgi:hypothetical protein
MIPNLQYVINRIFRVLVIVAAGLFLVFGAVRLFLDWFQ